MATLTSGSAVCTFFLPFVFLLELSVGFAVLVSVAIQTRDDDLRDHFEKYGKIVDVFIPRERDGAARGFGFISFEDARDAEDAAKYLNE